MKVENALFNPQLLLTAIIARRGTFEGINTTNVESVAYIPVLGRTRDDKKETETSGEKANDEFNAAEERFIALISHYDDPATPYLSQPRPQFVEKYGDYDHLARRRERDVAEGDDESD